MTTQSLCNQLDPTSSSLTETLDRISAWSINLLRKPIEAWRTRQVKAEQLASLAALDNHLLADIGLRRSGIGPACFLPDQGD
jgi:uncharacterized protein YjiS (DUF1127 family)